MRTLLALSLLSSAPALACTVVVSHTDDGVIVGNNEDWIRTKAKLWYEPPGKMGPKGAVFFGFEGGGRFPQGGMNESGLFFDGLGIDRVALKTETRSGRRAAPTLIFRQLLQQAETVDEVATLLEPYFIPFIKNAQMIFVDRHGGVLVLNVNGTTLHETVPRGEYRVVSNAPVEGPWEATEAITGVPEACDALEASPGADGVTHALIATHQESVVQTIYSTVFDLSQGTLTNYYLYDYDHPWVVSVADPPTQTVRFREHWDRSKRRVLGK